MEIIIYSYLVIAAICAFATGLWMLENSIKGIDNFWDWIIYNLLWMVQPIKSIIKFIKNQVF